MSNETEKLKSTDSIVLECNANKTVDGCEGFIMIVPKGGSKSMHRWIGKHSQEKGWIITGFAAKVNGVAQITRDPNLNRALSMRIKAEIEKQQIPVPDKLPPKVPSIASLSPMKKVRTVDVSKDDNDLVNQVLSLIAHQMNISVEEIKDMSITAEDKILLRARAIASFLLRIEYKQSWTILALFFGSSPSSRLYGYVKYYNTHKTPDDIKIVDFVREAICGQVRKVPEMSNELLQELIDQSKLVPSAPKVLNEENTDKEEREQYDYQWATRVKGTSLINDVLQNKVALGDSLIYTLAFLHGQESEKKIAELFKISVAEVHDAMDRCSTILGENESVFQMFVFQLRSMN
ncbi:MAG: hypothetical protein M3Q80_01555 [bacterium]|nr:hypothetical protein [bacterium]